MRGNWKRHLILLAVFAAGIVQVTDVFAVWPFRRRANYGNYNNGYNGSTYGTTNTYGAAPMYGGTTYGGTTGNYGAAPVYGGTTGTYSAAPAYGGTSYGVAPAGATIAAPGVVVIVTGRDDAAPIR